MLLCRRQKQSIDLEAQPLMLRQALNWVQQRRRQPAMSAVASKAVAVQTLLQERKSSLQTRTLWLPGPQGDGEGLSD
jgi:hypothetical protein